jgi:hypothetical protein
MKQLKKLDPFRRMDVLIRNAEKYIQSWVQRRVGNVKLKISMENTIIFQFDVSQETRRFTLAESWLRNRQMVLGLASLERTIIRQRSRIRWL